MTWGILGVSRPKPPQRQTSRLACKWVWHKDVLASFYATRQFRGDAFFDHSSCGFDRQLCQRSFVKYMAKNQVPIHWVTGTSSAHHCCRTSETIAVGALLSTVAFTSSACMVTQSCFRQPQSKSPKPNIQWIVTTIETTTWLYHRPCLHLGFEKNWIKVTIHVHFFFAYMQHLSPKTQDDWYDHIGYNHNYNIATSLSACTPALF